MNEPSVLLTSEILRSSDGDTFAARVVALAVCNGMPIPALSDAAAVLHEWSLAGDGLPELSEHVARECAAWLSLNKADTYRVLDDEGVWVLARLSSIRAAA